MPVQIFFGRNMILLINHVADWRYISQHKQAQINKYFIRKNTNRIDQDYRVGDKIMINNRSVYKYKTPFRGPCKVFQIWKNGTVTL